MSHLPIRIVQISDTHLLADKDGSLLGVKTEESFNAVVNLLKHDKKKPDAIIHTGDMTQDGSAVSYLKIAKILSQFNVPVYYVPGNHDDLAVISDIYPQEMISNNRHIVFKKWQLILLNSQKPGAVEGFLDSSQIRFMQSCLKMHPELHTILVLHHHPIPMGCEWLDQLGLRNADDFWEITEHYSTIKSVIHGHVHQEHQGDQNGILCLAVPSTCIQFKRNQNEFGLEKLPPGYRWLELYDDGRIETGINRVAEYVGIFDEKAQGY